MSYFELTRITLFGWTEPYPLLVFVLLLLIILPAIFKTQHTFLKITRIYNSTRLGLISILHQVVYVYTLAHALELFVSQGSACIHASTFYEFTNFFAFPQSTIMSTAFLGFSVIRFTSLPRAVALPVFAAVLGFVLFTELCQTLTTALQGIVSICLGYIVHFAHVHIPFRLVHIENAVTALLCATAGLLTAQDPAWGYRAAFADLGFPAVLLAIDEIVLARHHLTRGGFTTIERPADINWAAERDHAETIRLLSSEEETNMERNVGSDFVTSVFAFIAIFIGVTVRKSHDPAFFSHSG
jgi:hypothetical protein